MSVAHDEMKNTDTGECLEFVDVSFQCSASVFLSFCSSMKTLIREYSVWL